MTRASTAVFWISLTIMVSLGLYHTSYRVENLGRTLRTINTHIQAEQQSLHILKAEWVYLANPARIEKAAQKHLDLKPTAPAQVTKIARLPEVLPTTKEAMNRVATSKPLASLRAHAAARTPKVSGQETDRLNTRLVFSKTAPIKTESQQTSLSWTPENSFALATAGQTP